MVSKTTKYLIGVLAVVIAATSAYVMISGSVKIDVQPAYTNFYIWNGSWIKSGAEYGILYNGTRQVNVTSTVINTTFLPGNMTQITRTRLYKGGASIIDTYLFDGNTKDVNLFPVIHRTDIYNATGFIFNYEVRGLSGNVTNKVLNGTEAEFGLKMKIVWDKGYYSANSYSSGKKVIIRYRINSTNYTLNNRLFDPDFSIYTAKNFFVKLKTNYADLSYGEATFDLYQPSLVDIPVSLKWLNFTTQKYLGRSGVDSMDVFYGMNVTTTMTVPIYDNYCINITELNGSITHNCTLVLNGTEKKTTTEYKYVPIDTLDTLKAKTTYDIKIVGTWKADPQKSVDWIPNLDLGVNKYYMNDWAWWNTSWDKCLQINLSGTYPANYTHTIELWNSTFNFTNILSTGADIRTINGTCTGGGSEIYHVVPEWNTSRNNNIIFVKTVGDSTTDNKVSVFFNYSSATDNSDCNRTFDAGVDGCFGSSTGWTVLGGAAVSINTTNKTIDFATSADAANGVYATLASSNANFSIWTKSNIASVTGLGGGTSLQSSNSVAIYNSRTGSVYANYWYATGVARHFFASGSSDKFDIGGSFSIGTTYWTRTIRNGSYFGYILSTNHNLSSPSIYQNSSDASTLTSSYLFGFNTWATGYGSDTITGKIYNVFYTKYVNPEPTYAFGIVETYVPPPPVISVVFPLNNTRSQNYTLAVSVNSNNSVMNVTFYNMTSAGAICTNASVTNGTIYCNWATLACGTPVTWNATVKDTSTTVQTGLYNFTYNCPPYISNAMSNATTIDAYQSARFNATVVFDSDNDTVKFYVQAPYGNLNLSSSGNSGSHYWLICNSTNPCKTNQSGTYLMSSVWANDTSNVTANLTSTANFIVNPPILTLCLNGNCTSDMRYELGSKALLYANATYSNGSIMNVTICLNLTTDLEQSQLSCSSNGTIVYNWTTTAYQNKLTCYNNASDCIGNKSDVTLVGYWSANDILISGRNQTVIYDQSGYGNNGNYTGETFFNGTFINNPNVSFSDGKFGGGVNFTGTTGLINVSNISGMSTSQITVMGWVRLFNNATSGRAGFFSQGTYYQNDSAFAIDYEYGNDRTHFSVGKSYCWISNGIRVGTGWIHLALKYQQGVGGAGYINGTPVCSFLDYGGPINYTQPNISIGITNASSGYPLNGSVDEFKIYNITLTDTQIAQEANSTYPLNTIGLKVWMPSNEGSGNGTKDWHNFVVGKDNNSGTALKFDGVDDYVNVGRNRNFEIDNNSFSIFTWVNGYSLSSPQFLVSKYPASSPEWELYIGSTGKATCLIRNATVNTPAYGITTLQNNTWYQVGCVYDRSTAKTTVYVNGINNSIDTASGGGNMTSTSNIFIGARTPGTSYFNGSIDDVRIYNRSLSATEVWNEYTSQKSKFILNYTSGSENKTVYMTLNKYDEANSANLYIYGLNTSGSYPSNVRIYINGTLDKYYGGTFYVGTSNTTSFTDNTSLTNVSISSTGYAYKYVAVPAEAVAQDACNLSFIAKKNEGINYYDTLTNETYRKVNSTSYWTYGVTINRTLDSNMSNSDLVGKHCYCIDAATCASNECQYITDDNYTGAGVLGNGIGYMNSPQSSYDGFNLSPNQATYTEISSSVARGLSVGGCYKWTNYAYTNYTLNCTSTDTVNLNAMLYAYPVNITESYADERMRYAAYIYLWNYTSASWQSEYTVDNAYGYPWAALNISGSYALDSSTCSGGRAQVHIQAKAKIRSYGSDDCTGMWDVCSAGGYSICGTNTTIHIYTINSSQSVYNDFSTESYSETGYSTPVYTSSNNIPEVSVTINYTGNLSFFVSNNGGANTSLIETLANGSYNASHKYVTFGGARYFSLHETTYLFKETSGYVYNYVYFPATITALEYFNGYLFVGTASGYIYYSSTPDVAASYTSVYLPTWNAGWTGGVSAMAGCDYSSTHEMVFFSTGGGVYWWIFGGSEMYNSGITAYATDAVFYGSIYFNSGDGIYYMTCPLYIYDDVKIDYDASDSISNFRGFAPYTTSWAFGADKLYFRDGYWWNEVGSTSAGNVVAAVYNGTNTFFSSDSNGTIYKYQSGVTEEVASQQGINNASLLLLDTDLYFVGTTSGETYFGKYIPNSYSEVTTASGSVDNITFQTSGTNITWKVIMNSTGSRTIGPNLTMVNITVGGRYPNNLSIKVGYLTSAFDTSYSSTGEMNESNGTINVTFDIDDINSILDVCSINTTTGNCDIPITFMADTEGSFEIQNVSFNYTFNPNPIMLNITLINRYLNESSVGNISIPIRIESETNGTINVSSMNINYNGSTIHGITAYTTDTTLSRLIQIFYSVWSYAFPSGIEYLEFLPSYPTSKNVTPWGQGEFTPILNITHLNTTTNIYADFKISVNESLSCVNISASNSSTKGGVINTTFSQLYTTLYSTFGLWLWADFECSYNNWYLFNPGLDIKACCQNCVCD